LNLPYGVALDSSGNLYIADTGNNAIREWIASTQQMTTLVSAGLNAPHGVAVDGQGNVYIADAYNNAVEEWSPATQQLTTLVSSGLNFPLAWRWMDKAMFTSRISATTRSSSGVRRASSDHAGWIGSEQSHGRGGGRPGQCVYRGFPGQRD
jgi:DNA-binding beta-propeller fold protein YncE